MKWIVIFAAASFISIFSATRGLLNTKRALLSRQKRFLVYEEGLNWVQMVAGIGLPVEVKDNSITMGAVVKSYYELPTNSSSYTRPTIDIARRKRSSRWKLYSGVEMFMESLGHSSGKSCLLRTICESSFAPFDERKGLLSEILHLFFTPSSTAEETESHFDQQYYAAEKLGQESENCNLLFPCDTTFMEEYTKVFIFD